MLITTSFSLASLPQQKKLAILLIDLIYNSHQTYKNQTRLAIYNHFIF